MHFCEQCGQQAKMPSSSLCHLIHVLFECAAHRLHTRNGLVKTSFCQKPHGSSGSVHCEFTPQWTLCMWKPSKRSQVWSSTVKCSHCSTSPPEGTAHCDHVESAQRSVRNKCACQTKLTVENTWSGQPVWRLTHARLWCAPTNSDGRTRSAPTAPKWQSSYGESVRFMLKSQANAAWNSDCDSQFNTIDQSQRTLRHKELCRNAAQPAPTHHPLTNDCHCDSSSPWTAAAHALKVLLWSWGRESGEEHTCSWIGAACLQHGCVQSNCASGTMWKGALCMTHPPCPQVHQSFPVHALPN